MVFSSTDLGRFERKVKLFSCPIDEVPGNEKHVAVRQEGIITVEFDISDVQSIPSRYSARLNKTVYKVVYEVEVDFRSPKGILTFRSYYEGRQTGRTTIEFNR